MLSQLFAMLSQALAVPNRIQMGFTIWIRFGSESQIKASFETDPIQIQDPAQNQIRNADPRLIQMGSKIPFPISSW